MQLPGGSWPTLRAATMAPSQSSSPRRVEQISFLDECCLHAPRRRLFCLLRRWYHLLKRVNGVQQLAVRYKRSDQKFAKTASGTVAPPRSCLLSNAARPIRTPDTYSPHQHVGTSTPSATGGTFHGFRNEDPVEHDVIGWCIEQQTEPPRTDVDERTIDGLMPQL
jgi:hypothetical protein